jgi:hypothetical protein
MNAALKSMLAVTWLTSLTVGQAALPSTDAIERVLTHVPPQAAAAIIVPNLKRCSDEIAQCLEGMERADLLQLARPLDQLKSMVGLNIAVDDAGSAAAVVFDPAGGLKQAAFLIPVKDAEQFLSANFQAGNGPGRYLLGDGSEIHAKALGTHVMLAEAAGVVQSFNAGPGSAAALRDRMGERGWSLATTGDLIMVADPSAVDLPVAMPGPADRGTVVLFTIDFDPLGLIIRSLTRFDPAGDVGARLTGGAGGGSWLSRVPAKAAPYDLAGSMSVAGIGGAEAIRALVQSAGLGEPPAWTALVKGIQFASHPSPAGLQGGILNDAAIVFETDNPGSVRVGLRDSLLALHGEIGGVERSVSWTDDKPLSGKDAGNADAYEVSIFRTAPEAGLAAMVQPLLTGNAGWRGFVETIDDAVIMTFSQRPIVLQQAIEAASGSSPTLESDPAIAVIRQWFPPHADAQAFINVGRFIRLASQIGQSFGVELPIALPEAAVLDPVGLAMDVNDHAVETTMVVPASVLRLALDLAVQLRLDASPTTPAPSP